MKMLSAQHQNVIRNSISSMPGRMKSNVCNEQITIAPTPSIRAENETERRRRIAIEASEKRTLTNEFIFFTILAGNANYLCRQCLKAFMVL